jgi:hypothetical protein
VFCSIAENEGTATASSKAITANPTSNSTSVTPALHTFACRFMIVLPVFRGALYENTRRHEIP